MYYLYIRSPDAKLGMTRFVFLGKKLQSISWLSRITGKCLCNVAEGTCVLWIVMSFKDGSKWKSTWSYRSLKSLLVTLAMDTKLSSDEEATKCFPIFPRFWYHVLAQEKSWHYDSHLLLLIECVLQVSNSRKHENHESYSQNTYLMQNKRLVSAKIKLHCGNHAQVLFL